MQPNEITLAVDVANDGNTTNYVFNRSEEYLNRSVYFGENHEISSRDMLTIYRTPQKQQGNFKGVAKSAIKFTTDTLVTGVDGIAQLTSPLIVEVSFSIPVGATSNLQLLARQKAIALLDNDTIMNDLSNKLII